MRAPCLLLLLSLLLTLPADAQQQFKMEGRPGEAPGPWLFGTIGVGKKADGAPATTALKGLAIVLGQREAGVCYDLDLCRVAGAWTGGFVTPMNLMSRGDYPRSIGEPLFFGPESAGWQILPEDGARAPWKDPRDEPYGPLPQVQYRGMHVCGSEIAILWRIDGAEVLERPDFAQLDNGVNCLTRAFEIAPHPHAFYLTLYAAGDQQKGKIGAFCSDGAKVETDGGETGLRIPAAEKPLLLTVQIVSGEDPAAVQSALDRGAKPPASLRYLTTGGAAHEAPNCTTAGEVATAPKSPADPANADAAAPATEAYVVDTIRVPDPNPWKVPMFIGGLDFFPDGRAAVCTFHGDVFIVSGLDKTLQKVRWDHIASGLYHALGLKIVDNEIYVTCRDGITRLKDLNGDGEIDFYERFNNDLKVTPSFHEFVFDLQTDPAGNFYFAKAGPVKNGGRGFDTMMSQHGTLMRVSPDGQTLDVFATGFRAPNGLGVSPSGQVTAADNEGTWTPACRLDWVERGGFYGCVPTAHRANPPTDYDKPLCWLPKRVDNSSGGQVWAPDDDRWGPWRGELLHMSYGTCKLFGVLKEQVQDPTRPDCCDNVMQGGVVQFPLTFQSGIMRARFNPADGQLYVAGLRGWQTTGLKNGCFQRVRYTGAPVRMPIEMHVHKDGIELRFACSLDTQKACDTDNWNVEVWNYLWSSAYGSPEISTIAPAKEAASEPGKDGELQYTAADLGQKHHDALEIRAITAGTDDRSVFLEIPGLKPVMQMSIRYRIRSSDGLEIKGEVVNTVHGFTE